MKFKLFQWTTKATDTSYGAISTISTEPTVSTAIASAEHPIGHGGKRSPLKRFRFFRRKSYKPDQILLTTQALKAQLAEFQKKREELKVVAGSVVKEAQRSWERGDKMEFERLLMQKRIFDKELAVLNNMIMNIDQKLFEVHTSMTQHQALGIYEKLTATHTQVVDAFSTYDLNLLERREKDVKEKKLRVAKFFEEEEPSHDQGILNFELDALDEYMKDRIDPNAVFGNPEDVEGNVLPESFIEDVPKQWEPCRYEGRSVNDIVGQWIKTQPLAVH